MKSRTLFALRMNSKAQALLAALFLGGSASTQAQLAWEKTEIELHPKTGDAEAIANFKYENKGKTPIKILAVKTSCGCTAASSKKDEVAPGEKGEITATFKIGGRTGAQQKSIAVETDDPSQPVTNLILKADIQPPIEVQPTFVYWQAGEPAKAKTVTVKASKDVKITKLEANSAIPEFLTKVEKGSAPGVYTISIQPKDTAQPLNAMVTIQSPELPLPYYVTARVTGPAAAGR